MPTINLSKLVPIFYLQQYIVDKDTGLPLAAGVLTFYKDQARTFPKPIYVLTGVAPNYVATQVNDVNGRIVLSSVGTFQDTYGNDIMAYFYPLDDAGNSELYYITCDSSGGVRQWTRQGEPDPGVIIPVINQGEFENYIANGQFYIHMNLPSNGLITTTGIAITPGTWNINNSLGAGEGWYFFRSNTSSTDYVTFSRFGSPINNPTGNPRYACRLQCTVAAPGQASKRIYYVFNDCSKFASASMWTLFFSGQSNGGAPVQVRISIEKNYGISGSANTFSLINQQIISTSYENFNVNFPFNSNDSKNYGTDDGYVALVFEFPTDYPFDVSLTDFVLTPGNETIVSFPEESTAQISYRTLAMPIPNVDGSDLLLPVILTKAGFKYNDADVGKVFDCFYSSPKPGELEMNGQMIDPATYSPEGVPYTRLQSKLFNYTTNLPYTGTGSEFVTTLVSSSSTSSLFVNTNSTGFPATATLGAVPPPFTLSHINIGDPTFEFTASAPNGTQVYVYNNIVGAVLNIIDPGTSGFTTSNYYTGNSLAAGIDVITIASVAALSGTYFLISNTTTDFYVWFKVDGVGVDPAVVGRTGIEIDLLSTFNIADVCLMIAQTLSGFYTFNLSIVNASLMAGGQYFNFTNSLGAPYYIYYIVDGTGADPMIPGATGIAVSIASTESAADVTSDTQYAINTTSYSIPDIRAFFVRAWNHGRNDWNCDPDAATRYVTVGGLPGDNVGSWQRNDYITHTHPYVVPGNPTRNTDPGGPSPIDLTSGATGPSGNKENRPNNIYLMKVIKY